MPPCGPCPTLPLCKPVSVSYRTGLRHSKTEIGKWRAETRAAAPIVGGSPKSGDHAAETGLAGWAYEIRTPESVRKEIHLNWRHNFRGFGRNSAAETVRV